MKIDKFINRKLEVFIPIHWTRHCVVIIGWFTRDSVFPERMSDRGLGPREEGPTCTPQVLHNVPDTLPLVLLVFLKRAGRPYGNGGPLGSGDPTYPSLLHGSEIAGRRWTGGNSSRRPIWITSDRSGRFWDLSEDRDQDRTIHDPSGDRLRALTLLTLPLSVYFAGSTLWGATLNTLLSTLCKYILGSAQFSYTCARGDRTY